MGDNALRRRWRDLALGVATPLAAGLGAAAGRRQREARWQAGEPPLRVLFLRHDKIGDMLMSTGIIRAIAESRPGLALDVLASPANAPVLDGFPGVREVLPHQVRTAREAFRVGRALRERGYDAVVDGLVLEERVTTVVAMLMAGTGALARIGVGGGRQQEHVYTHRVPPPPNPQYAHHVRWLAQLALPFGVRGAAVPHPTVALSSAERAAAEAAWQAGAPEDAARQLRLLVNLSAGTPHRRWADEQFAGVLAHVAARYPRVRVAVIGDRADRASVAALAAGGGALAPATPGVRDAIALVAAADVVLTPDTAIGHAAAAFGRACVAMLLPRTERFAPYDTPGEVLVSPGPLLRSLPADAVVDAVDRALGALASPHP